MKPFEPVILRSKVRVFQELYQQRKLIETFYYNLEQIVEARTAELKEANETISRLAATDELTNLSNRRSFNDRLDSALSSARRHEYPLSMIMIDLDHFKTVNDTFGHSKGDQVLKAFADVLREIIRAEDFAARWGGEEFAIILQHTSREAASALAERIRVAFEQYSNSTFTMALSASFGVVQLQAGEDSVSLIRRADDALYKAKHEGRNRVVTA
jgi:diguanylate cyclase (GGDEF)-like protein